MKFDSVNGLMKRWKPKLRFFLGTLADMVATQIAQRPRIRNAHARMVQAKPIRGSRWLTISGKTTPPTEEPATVNPPANALALRKYVIGCDTIVSDHLGRSPLVA